jgi:hypothetical protein
MLALPLLLATLLSFPTPALVLHGGARIEVDGGSVKESQGRLVFRSHGALYSLPAAEVDLDATRAAASAAPPVSERAAPGERAMKLKVSEAERDRLLAELARNHLGRPASPTALDVAPELLDPPSPAEKASSEEWSWRRQARAHEEAIRQAQEQVAMLRDKAERLRSEIGSFLSLGYKPGQFTYQTSELQFTLEQIPRSELEVRRAQRAYDEFRDDARKLGVTPGWLR